MQLDAAGSQGAVLEALTRAAEATWGGERLGALQPTLEMAAAALWELAQQPLEPTGVEPDFVSGGDA